MPLDGAAVDTQMGSRVGSRGARYCPFLKGDTRLRCPEQIQSRVSESDTALADHDEFILATGRQMDFGRIATTIMLPFRQCGQTWSEWPVSSS